MVQEPSLQADEKAWADRVFHRKYYPHIDGLRCLAVIPVVLYHLASGLCPGGFIGVDIFFVISGYLIYGGIAEDLRKGTFSMTSFYHRRIRRIFPAYFVVVSSTLVAGITLYHWTRLLPLAQTTLFSALFSANLYFWLLIGYFHPEANQNPLLHLWTLGVEEQFYLVIPLICLGIAKISRRSLTPALLIFSLGSFALCVALSQSDNSTTAFYLLPTRAWELLAGALLAELPRRHGRRGTWLLSALGLVLILLPCWCFSIETIFMNGGTSVELLVPGIGSLGFFPFPGVVITPVVAGILLLLRYGDTGLVYRLLGSLPFTAIGKISYSLYLWHWPIIVFARYIQYDRQSPLDLTVIFFGSILAAYLSWRWVEMPIRLSKSFDARRAFLSTAVGCAFLVAVSGFLIYTDGLRYLLHRQANHYASPQLAFLSNFEKFVRRTPFHPTPYSAIDPNYFKRLGVADGKPTFCLMGDSLAGALAPGLDRAAKEQGQSGLCISIKIAPYVDESVPGTVLSLLEWVGRDPDIHDVYLVCNWLKQNHVYDGVPALGDVGKIQPVVIAPATLQTLENNLRHTAQWFRQHGKRVFVFTSDPEYRYAPADVMARSQIIPYGGPIAMTRQDYLDQQQDVTRLLARLQQEGIFTVVPAGETLLSGDQTLVMGPDGAPYYRDGDHFTPDGAYYVCRALAPLLWGTGAGGLPAK